MLYWCLSNVLEALELAAEARLQALKRRSNSIRNSGWGGGVSVCMTPFVRDPPKRARPPKRHSPFIPNPRYNIGLLAGVLGNAGETTQSEALLERLPTGTAGASVARSCFHLVRGESAAAVQCAGAALDEGYLLAPCMFVLPFERFLRQSPGWRTLMRKLNLPESR